MNDKKASALYCVLLLCCFYSKSTATCQSKVTFNISYGKFFFCPSGVSICMLELCPAMQSQVGHQTFGLTKFRFIYVHIFCQVSSSLKVTLEPNSVVLCNNWCCLSISFNSGAGWLSLQMCQGWGKYCFFQEFTSAGSKTVRPESDWITEEGRSLSYCSIYWTYFYLAAMELWKKAKEIGTFHKNPVTTFLPSPVLVLHPCVQSTSWLDSPSHNKFLIPVCFPSSSFGLTA